jgi:hypothetical protein
LRLPRLPLLPGGLGTRGGPYATAPRTASRGPADAMLPGESIERLVVRRLGLYAAAAQRADRGQAVGRAIGAQCPSVAAVGGPARGKGKGQIAGMRACQIIIALLSSEPGRSSARYEGSGSLASTRCLTRRLGTDGLFGALNFSPILNVPSTSTTGAPPAIVGFGADPSHLARVTLGCFKLIENCVLP